MPTRFSMPGPATPSGPRTRTSSVDRLATPGPTAGRHSHALPLLTGSGRGLKHSPDVERTSRGVSDRPSTADRPQARPTKPVPAAGPRPASPPSGRDHVSTPFSLREDHCMFLSPLLKLLTRKPATSRPARRPPRLEGLEDRWVPATLTVD